MHEKEILDERLRKSHITNDSFKAVCFFEDTKINDQRSKTWSRSKNTTQTIEKDIFLLPIFSVFDIMQIYNQTFDIKNV